MCKRKRLEETPVIYSVGPGLNSQTAGPKQGLAGLGAEHTVSVPSLSLQRAPTHGSPASPHHQHPRAPVAPTPAGAAALCPSTLHL